MATRIPLNTQNAASNSQQFRSNPGEIARSTIQLTPLPSNGKLRNRFVKPHSSNINIDTPTRYRRTTYAAQIQHSRFLHCLYAAPSTLVRSFCTPEQRTGFPWFYFNLESILTCPLLNSMAASNYHSDILAAFRDRSHYPQIARDYLHKDEAERYLDIVTTYAIRKAEEQDDWHEVIAHVEGSRKDFGKGGNSLTLTDPKVQARWFELVSSITRRMRSLGCMIVQPDLE